MQNVVRDFRSEPLSLALVQGNSIAPAFSPLDVQTVQPDQATVSLTQSLAMASLADGIYENGFGGDVGAGRLLLFPYGDGAAGATFSLRVYGWRSYQNRNSQSAAIWIPHLLCDLACVLCNRAGPANLAPLVSPVAQWTMRDTERFCDTIALAQGSLGLEGEINSTGPGTDLIATATVDLKGCLFFSFDFSQATLISPASLASTNDPVAMNAFWARL